MVDLASKVMTGSSLAELGYGTGLYKIPPYFTVKVPVFSFEKLNDVNSTLGPEMKSTGEVLGIGKTLTEALFKGLTAAGYNLKNPAHGDEIGVLVSVDEHEYLEIVGLAKKLDDLGMKLYATPGTAKAIEGLGIDVITVDNLKDSNEIYDLLESDKISYIVYTGALYDSTLDDYIELHRRAVNLSIPCMTALDTANAFADVVASRFTQKNTELVDINDMREARGKLKFAKMQGTGDDYIFIENFDGKITCPESLCVSFCDRHYGIGADGIVLMEHSDVADVKMRIFNRDGSEGRMAGNSIRCLAKYVIDNGIVKDRRLTVETNAGIKNLECYSMNERVKTVSVDMGKPEFSAKEIPFAIEGDKFMDYEITVADEKYRVNLVSMGNPHAVVFCSNVNAVDLDTIGSAFEESTLFPKQVNLTFARVVNQNTIKMRTFERGNGETLACGTGACAAVVSAVENGFCKKGDDVTVKVPGGDLIVNYSDEKIVLTGNAELVYEGETEF